MENIYTYRSFRGAAKYEVIDHSDDWNTIIAKDTTCSDHANCIVELIKDTNGYKYNKPVNKSAEKYEYFHNENNYFSSAELCFIDFINKEIITANEKISSLTDKINIANTKIAKRKLPVKYLTADNW